MEQPPRVDIAFENLPTEPKERRELMVDIFGWYLFWAIGEAIQKSQALVQSPEARNRLATAFRQPYLEAASTLNSDQQGIALALVKDAVENFAKIILALLQAKGISHRMGDNHAVRFRLIMEVCEIEEMKIVFEEIINRGGEKAFVDYWGRWKNRSDDRFVT